jgi:ABC-type multidrug transport system fused ATPase/permease subunit
MEIMTLSELLVWLRTPLGLGVAVAVLMEMGQRYYADSAWWQRAGLVVSLALSIVLPAGALLVATWLGLDTITPDSVYLALAATFVTSQSLYAIKHGVEKIGSL